MPLCQPLHKLTNSARARFLVETLVNVKNGKAKTGNGVEQSNEAAARMKKFLSGLGRKRRRESDCVWK